jgi:hypothetical protein
LHVADKPVSTSNQRYRAQSRTLHSKASSQERDVCCTSARAMTQCFCAEMHSAGAGLLLCPPDGGFGKRLAIPPGISQALEQDGRQERALGLVVEAQAHQRHRLDHAQAVRQTPAKQLAVTHRQEEAGSRLSRPKWATPTPTVWPILTFLQLPICKTVSQRTVDRGAGSFARTGPGSPCR